MLAIIGGTGLYQFEALEVLDSIACETPFGFPSAPVIKGRLGAHELLFLTRHGAGHAQLPHEINYRANIFALKSLGATQIIGVSAVGSLREEIAPGDLALPDQYFDWTRGRREASFFGRGVAAHVSTANPASANLIEWIAAHAQQRGVKVHKNVTYGCVEGPRLGTRAESHFLRQVGCDVVGMTNVPEAFLAREAQICYSTIGIATDYDCWMEDPSKHVTVDSIFALYGQSLGKVRDLLQAMLQHDLPAEEPAIRTALAASMMTPDSALNEVQTAWMKVLRS
ncbi:MAG: S-methyl-5'-thioinosine phosphorylase [Burkholderiaceae bacterium]|nr:S-methyl-5'-thioinosine phosphorylase [Burkholderiaceae bacterium]